MSDVDYFRIGKIARVGMLCSLGGNDLKQQRPQKGASGEPEVKTRACNRGGRGKGRKIRCRPPPCDPGAGRVPLWRVWESEISARLGVRQATRPDEKADDARLCARAADSAAWAA